jgi:hypothetical protein
MAYSNIHPIQTYKAGAADLAYGTAVKLMAGAAEPTVVQATAAADDVVGFVFNPVYVEGANVGVLGQQGNKCEVIAAGAIAVGDSVAVTAKGYVAKATSGKVVGKAMTAASEAGQFLTILLEKATLA